MNRLTVHIGDCRETLKGIPDASADSCVTDPPYELGFMGKAWDKSGVAYDVAMWREVFRVLKPGAHLLAFGGTRTFHRMACAIEDAGFEIRDQIGWAYGSGFPKSLDVSKAIDKEAGVKREVIGQRVSAYGSDTATGERLSRDGGGAGLWVGSDPKEVPLTGDPITDAAKQWDGWGTALKPSHEPVVIAQKPLENHEEWATMKTLIQRLWSRLWTILPANSADRLSQLSPLAFGVDPSASAQWSAASSDNTRAALCALMDTSQFELAMISSLNTALSWSGILAARCHAESTSTTGTASSGTTDLQTLRCCLSKITPEDIILAHRTGAWSNVNASNAARYLSATLATFAATLELSALESAIAQDLQPSPVGGVNYNPICVARKPLAKGCTVADNVLRHGTGALNIDGCRIDTKDNLNGGTYSPGGKSGPMPGDQRTGAALGMFQPGARPANDFVQPEGRWPANLIHDGSEEVMALFPNVASGEPMGIKAGGKLNCFGEFAGGIPVTGFGDSGSAARFFYCAKVSPSERGDSTHPTMKPLALMRYLVRLVTPPGGRTLDPFGGSGTTAVAAIEEGFCITVCELDPENAALIHKRTDVTPGLAL